jgi:hypothetical protein
MIKEMHLDTIEYKGMRGHKRSLKYNGDESNVYSQLGMHVFVLYRKMS